MAVFLDHFWVILTKTWKFCAIFWSFMNVLVAFNRCLVFLTYFENSTEIMCYFLKSPKFGSSPKIREFSQNSGSGDSSTIG